MKFGKRLREFIRRRNAAGWPSVRIIANIIKAILGAR